MDTKLVGEPLVSYELKVVDTAVLFRVNNQAESTRSLNSYSQDLKAISIGSVDIMSSIAPELRYSSYQNHSVWLRGSDELKDNHWAIATLPCPEEAVKFAYEIDQALQVFNTCGGFSRESIPPRPGNVTILEI